MNSKITINGKCYEVHGYIIVEGEEYWSVSGHCRTTFRNYDEWVQYVKASCRWNSIPGWMEYQNEVIRKEETEEAYRLADMLR